MNGGFVMKGFFSSLLGGFVIMANKNNSIGQARSAVVRQFEFDILRKLIDPRADF